MGARLLRDWLSAPLTDLQQLNTRQLAVNRLTATIRLRTAIDDASPTCPTSRDSSTA